MDSCDVDPDGETFVDSVFHALQHWLGSGWPDVTLLDCGNAGLEAMGVSGDCHRDEQHLHLFVLAGAQRMAVARDW